MFIVFQGGIIPFLFCWCVNRDCAEGKQLKQFKISVTWECGRNWTHVEMSNRHMRGWNVEENWSVGGYFSEAYRLLSLCLEWRRELSEWFMKNFPLTRTEKMINTHVLHVHLFIINTEKILKIDLYLIPKTNQKRLS